MTGLELFLRLCVHLGLDPSQVMRDGMTIGPTPSGADLRITWEGVAHIKPEVLAELLTPRADGDPPDHPTPPEATGSHQTA